MQKIFLSNTQTQRLNFELQQAIKIMNLSYEELNATIREKLAENFALELDYDKLNKVSPFSYNDYNYLNIDDLTEKAQELSLSSFLLNQIEQFTTISYDMEIIEDLISCITDSGYLNESELTKNTLESEEYEYHLKIIQSLEPSGVGGRNLSEVLLIQAQDTIPRNLVSEYIIKDKLEYLINSKNIQELQKHIIAKFDISKSEFIEAIDFIKELNPKPGYKFSPTKNYIVPDCVVETTIDGFQVKINNEHILPIKINNDIKNIIDNESTSKNDVEFINQKVKEAKMFIKSLYNRENTLQRVVQEIIKIQSEFLIKGEKYLKPLVMKEISKKCGLHESTISRIASKKYIKTEFGIYPLKIFFSNNIGAPNKSSASIKKELKELIQNENVEKPYTDQEICDIFKSKGVEISRRTISKYRKNMGILSTRKRKIKTN